MADFGKAALSKLQQLEAPYLSPVGFRDMHIGIRSNTNQTGTTRMRIFPQYECQDLVLAYANYYNGGTGTPTPNTNSLIAKASLEINGVLIPIFFNGSRTVTISGGGVVLSDSIPCVINPSDNVFIRTYFDAGVGGYIPINTRLCLLDGGIKDGVTYGSDLTDSGTVTDTSLADSYSASIMLGVTKSKKESVLLLGDSIISGTGDAIQTAHGVTGFAARALLDKKIGFNKISMGGEKVADSINSLYIRKPFFNDHTKVIVNYPTNDMSSTASLTTIKNNMLKLWRYLNTLGLTVYQCTITPKTTSTDNWMTLQNQTVQGGNTEPVRLGFNDWLRDNSANGAKAQSNGALFAVLDVASTVEASGGKWKIYSTPIFSGTVTSATSNTLTCSSMPLAERDLDAGTVVKITGGTGAGQVLQVDNNFSPATKITMKTNWTTIPDTTSTFEVYKVPTYDGTHPSRYAHIDMSANVNI